MSIRQNWRWLSLAAVVVVALATFFWLATSQKEETGLVYATDTTFQGRYASLSGQVSESENCMFVESGTEPVLLIWPQKSTVSRTDGNVTVSLDKGSLAVPGLAKLRGSFFDTDDPIVPKQIACKIRDTKQVFLVGGIL
jgi:hypothetical protein